MSLLHLRQVQVLQAEGEAISGETVESFRQESPSKLRVRYGSRLDYAANIRRLCSAQEYILIPPSHPPVVQSAPGKFHSSNLPNRIQDQR